MQTKKAKVSTFIACPIYFNKKIDVRTETVKRGKKHPYIIIKD